MMQETLSFEVKTVVNFLPYDGCAEYYGICLSTELADHFFKRLLYAIDWKADRARVAGREIRTKRKTAWFGDCAFDYTYSGITRTAAPWTDDLLQLKNIVEKTTRETFNACLLNLYHSGEEGMAWHSDDEENLCKRAAISSLSLGAERKFSFKHKNTKHTRSVLLEHGSLLVMKGDTQEYWWHRLPPTKKQLNPRINLTFRKIETSTIY